MDAENPNPTPSRSLRRNPGPGRAKGSPITRLKPERVQLVLRGLTDWQADTTATSMSRLFTFPSPRPATTFVQLVTELASDRKQEPEIYLHGSEVMVTLSTTRVKGLTLDDVRLARAISLVA